MATFKRILNLENYIFTFYFICLYGALTLPIRGKNSWEKPKHLLVLLPY